MTKYMGGLVFDGVWHVLSTVEEYNPLLDKWTKKADMLSPRASFATSTVNGKIYAFGGVDANLGQGISLVEEYDPIADKWTKKVNMPTARSALCAEVIGSKIYCIGGQIGQFGPLQGECVSVVEEYDMIRDTWTKKSDMQFTRALHTTIALNGHIYSIGGCPQDKRDTGTPTVEEYDPIKDLWTRKSDAPSGRYGCVIGEVNGKIYVMGGADDTNNVVGLQTVEEYTPEGWQPQSISPQGKMSKTWGKLKQNK
jgi:N-acetylneuraminic acid mutarotase